MSMATPKRPGFWGTFRSYLVAGSVLSVLAGVLGLYPSITVLKIFNIGSAAADPFSFSVYVAAVLHPLACFVSPALAYLAYREGRWRRAVVLLLVPLAVSAVFGGLVWFADDFCGGRIVC